MKTLLRWLTGVFLFLATALFTLTVTAPHFLPPEEQKAFIAALVEKQSGRKLTIEGNLQLRITPALHLFCSMDKAKLAGNPLFGDTPFLASEQTSLELSLWPLLLKKRLDITSLSMDNVSINLIRSKNNIVNWQHQLSQTPRDAQEKETEEPPVIPEVAEAPPMAPPLSFFIRRIAPLLQTVLQARDITMGRILLNGVNVRHENRLNGDIRLVNNLWVRVGKIRENVAFPFEAGGNFFQENILGTSPAMRSLDLTLQGNGTLSRRPNPVLLIEDLRSEGTVKAAFLHKKGLRFSSSGAVELHPHERKLVFRELSVRQGECVAQGEGSLEHPAEPHLNFSLTIPECSPQSLLRHLKNPPSLQQSPAEILQTFRAELKIDAHPGAARIHELTLHLDDSVVTGSLDLRGNNEELSSADFHIDKIDADRYQRLLNGIPLRQSKNNPLELNVTVDTLVSRGLTFTEAKLHLTGSKGMYEVSPFTATIQKGSVEVNGKINLSGKTAKMELHKKISKVPLGPFLLAETGREDLTGLATLDATVKVTGRNKQELWRQADGVMEFTLTGGEIKNQYLADTVAKCQASSTTAPASTPETPAENKISFSRIGGTAVFSKGLLSTSDLVVASAGGQFTGTAELNLSSGFTRLALHRSQPADDKAHQVNGEEAASSPPIDPPCQFQGNLDGSGIEVLPPAPTPTSEPPAVEQEESATEPPPQQEEEQPEPAEQQVEAEQSLEIPDKVTGD